MRYWRPADRHAGYVSGYHLYAVDPPTGTRQEDVFQPAWPMLRFVFGESTGWTVRPPGLGPQAIGGAALFGPTSGVTWSESGPGAVVGIGLMPRGWVRLTRDLASDWSNRVDRPAATDVAVSDVEVRLASIASDEDVPLIFDSFLDGAFGPVQEDDDIIGRMEAGLVDPAIASVGELAELAGCSTRTLERLARRAFGFTPKRLLRRARFLRSLHALAAAEKGSKSTAIDASYTDYSHFARDAVEFLGMSVQTFLGLDNPLLRQSVALRTAVLGAPAQALSAP